MHTYGHTSTAHTHEHTQAHIYMHIGISLIANKGKGTE